MVARIEVLMFSCCPPFRFASETEQDYISSERNAKLTNVRSAAKTLVEKQEVSFLMFRPAGLTLGAGADVTFCET